MSAESLYAMQPGVAEWKAHYGEALYKRFADAKRKYDPRGILTPGPGVVS